MATTKGQLILVVFCVLQTLLNLHLLGREMGDDRTAEVSEMIKDLALEKCHHNLRECHKSLEMLQSTTSKCPEVEKVDHRDEKFYAEPEEFRVAPPPKIFTLSEFDFTSISPPVLDECSCKNGKEALQKELQRTGFVTDNKGNITKVTIQKYEWVPMKYVDYNMKFINTPEAKARETRHESYLKRREWSRPLKIFANPNVPLKYPSSGVQCRPQGQAEIPLSITQVFELAKVKIVANYGEISIGADGTASQSLELEGDSEYLNKMLQNLTYKNIMFDSLTYYDTVTVWIQGFETVKFQVEVAREKVEILQVI